MSDDRYTTGMAVRRSVLGDAHVDRAESGTTGFDEDFQRFITEGAWGSVWSRPGLDRRTRSMLVIALMAALGHHEELALHLRATRNTGATVQDVQEVLLDGGGIRRRAGGQHGDPDRQADLCGELK